MGSGGNPYHDEKGRFTDGPSSGGRGLISGISGGRDRTVGAGHPVEFGHGSGGQGDPVKTKKIKGAKLKPMLHRGDAFNVEGPGGKDYGFVKKTEKGWEAHGKNWEQTETVMLSSHSPTAEHAAESLVKSQKQWDKMRVSRAKAAKKDSEFWTTGQGKGLKRMWED